MLQLGLIKCFTAYTLPHFLCSCMSRNNCHSISSTSKTTNTTVETVFSLSLVFICFLSESAPFRYFPSTSFKWTLLFYRTRYCGAISKVQHQKCFLYNKSVAVLSFVARRKLSLSTNLTLLPTSVLVSFCSAIHCSHTSMLKPPKWFICESETLYRRLKVHTVNFCWNLDQPVLFQHLIFTFLKRTWPFLNLSSFKFDGTLFNARH